MARSAFCSFAMAGPAAGGTGHVKPEAGAWRGLAGAQLLPSRQIRSAFGSWTAELNPLADTGHVKQSGRPQARIGGLEAA
jgi:hypothetical protein